MKSDGDWDGAKTYIEVECRERVGGGYQTKRKYRDAAKGMIE